MKVKTSELIGRALNWAVGACEKRGYREYSTDWALGGPIIEREWVEMTINTNVVGETWLATRVEGSAICEMTGPTQLVAAMRCYVKSQLGDEVDVPEELMAVV